MFLLHILAAQALAVVSRHHFKVMSNSENQIKNLKEASSLITRIQDEMQSLEDKNKALSPGSEDNVKDEVISYYALKEFKKILEFLGDKRDAKSKEDVGTVENYVVKFLSNEDDITLEEEEAFKAIQKEYQKDFRK